MAEAQLTVKRRLAAMLLPWMLAAAAAGLARAAEPAAEQAETVERILELQRQIETLLRSLPPEAQQELRRRLAEPVEEEPVAAAEPTAPAPPRVAPRRRGRPVCNTLDALDENGDNMISALDRYWRHLYLWSDANRDGAVQPPEIKSAFQRGVREISLRLTTFVRRKGTLGEIRVEERIVLDVRGNGFSGDDDGVLTVDATALARGDGPRLLAAGGTEVEGRQPFQQGWKIRDGDGAVSELSCP